MKFEGAQCPKKPYPKKNYSHQTVPSVLLCLSVNTNLFFEPGHTILFVYHQAVALPSSSPCSSGKPQLFSHFVKFFRLTFKRRWFEAESRTYLCAEQISSLVPFVFCSFVPTIVFLRFVCVFTNKSNKIRWYRLWFAQRVDKSFNFQNKQPTLTMLSVKNLRFWCQFGVCMFIRPKILFIGSTF